MGESLRVAAVVYGPDDGVDDALSAAATILRQNGCVLGGLLQRYGAIIGPCKREMLLDVLPDGGTIRLSDSRGPGVEGCILDTDALTRAAMAFHHAVESRPDLLLASRFGNQEIGGGGLRAELAEAMIAGIPLLVPVRISFLSAWTEFLGGPSEVLAPHADAILGWAASRHVFAPPRSPLSVRGG